MTRQRKTIDYFRRVPRAWRNQLRGTTFSGRVCPSRVRALRACQARAALFLAVGRRYSYWWLASANRNRDRSVATAVDQWGHGERSTSKNRECGNWILVLRCRPRSALLASRRSPALARRSAVRRQARRGFLYGIENLPAFDLNRTCNESACHSQSGSRCGRSP